MPLIRRLPKRGFNNAAFHKSYAIVNLNDLNRFDAGTDVNEQSLRAAKLIRGNFFGVKVLGDGELKHALNIEVDKISTSAREKIEKAGGKIMMRERTAVRTQAEPPETPAHESEDAPKLKKAKKTAAKKAVAKKSASKKKR